ncbi:signal peptidase I [Planctomonas psychrotolerans]|uniref:signal peptidase I n=1 Tax=Planctomonas psychrotolerans TaxID=2528712 RepID=UPI001D0D0CB1|nr:signal peptidase I [Planctomonas psychrotolerans]
MTDSTVPTDMKTVGKNGKPRLTGWKLFVRDILVIFVVALLVSVLIKTFLIRSFYIPSESMSDTLVENDRIIVNQLAPDLMALEHGDIVVFRDPGNWLAPVAAPQQNPLAAGVDWVLALVGLSAPDSNDHLIKRVIGMPGDHVVCCNEFGQLSVNDVPLKEPYVVLPPGETAVSQDSFDVTVPADSLWVMGDNRYNSKDSRYQRETPSEGFVPLDDVVGRALLISWPIARWEWLDNYEITFRGVETEGR